MAEAYPLDWPDSWKRTSSPTRSPFKTGFVAARKFLSAEVARLGARGLVISTNVPLRNDGMPRASMRPDYGDNGVAVYFNYKGNAMVLACDQYDRIYDNIYAVAKTIEAMRGIERWGASDMMERAFSGFKALSASNGKDWWEVLGVPRNSTKETIEINYRKLARERHPDHGGSHEQMSEINDARKRALEETND